MRKDRKGNSRSKHEEFTRRKHSDAYTISMNEDFTHLYMNYLFFGGQEFQVVVLFKVIPSAKMV